MSAYLHRVTRRTVASPPTRSLRRMLMRGACLTAVATLAWTTASTVVSAAPAPLVSSGMIGLRQGSQGSDVKSMQSALVRAGIPLPGGVDGVFGPATKGALIAFQKARGLPRSGEVDQATGDALATSGGGAGGSAYVGLKQGAKGRAVEDIQKRLVRFGVYLGGGVDGQFGPATERGVKQFQGWNGLAVTGAVDAATAKKLELHGSAATDRQPAAAANPSSGTGYVGLARGARGPLVKDLQRALQSTGLVVSGGADGIFGPATEAAVRAVQRVNGLSQSGVVGKTEARILGLGGGGGTNTAPAASPYRGLKVGAQGRAVKEVQAALIAAGVSVRGGADGAFGNVTKTALVSYQKSIRIPADGTVNQATIDKLGLGAGRGPVPFASNSGAKPPAARPSTGNSYVGLAVGARGPKVVELQKALQDIGLTVLGGHDGVFGVATRSALVAFQGFNGLTKNGVVSERAVKLLGLGTGKAQGTANPVSNVNVKLDRFPVQGQCYFADTWHAPRGGGRLHEGVDIIASQGKFLYAVVDGTISKQYWDQPGALSGNGLRVEQANGTYFTYLHMYSFAPGIRVGTKVKAGDVIGFIGTTGSSSTPHLHFEIHPGGGGAVNPYPYVKAINDCNNTKKRYQSSFS